MLKNGTLLDDYRILGVLGVGGFGITYLAEDETLRIRVAIKEFMPSHLATHDGTHIRPVTPEKKAPYERELENFLTEARNAARIQHPNVVRVRRCFKCNGTAYMVMDFEEGQSFEEYLRTLGRPPAESELQWFLRPFLDGLEAVHATGLVHRDIKPSNIYLRQADRSPVLLDFGAARQLTAEHFTAILTKGYAPIEQYEAKARQGPWTDVYGVAAVLYRAVTGNKPMPAVARLAQDRLVPVSECAAGQYSRPFLQAIDRGLALEPESRPQSLAAWRKDLLGVAAPGRTPDSGAPDSDAPDSDAPDSDATEAVEGGTVTAGKTLAGKTLAGKTLAGETLVGETLRGTPASTAPVSGDAPTLAAPVATNAAVAPVSTSVVAVDEAAWRSARSADTIEAYRAYLEAQPAGLFRNLADRAIEALRRIRDEEDITDPDAEKSEQPPPSRTAAAAQRVEVFGRVIEIGAPAESDEATFGTWEFVRPSATDVAVLGFLGLIVTILASIMLRNLMGTNLVTLLASGLVTFAAAFAYALFNRELNHYTRLLLAAGTALASLAGFIILVLMTS